MKKNFYKIISVILCAVLLNISIISSMSVKSFCDEVNPIEWLHDHFTETVSAIGGAVFNTTVDVWNAWKTLLGLNNDEFNDFIINGVSVGGDGKVSISDDIADSIKEFVNDYQTNNPDFKYGYTSQIESFATGFGDKRWYNAIRNKIKANPDKVYFVVKQTTLQSTTNTSKFYDIGGINNCFKLVEVSNVASCVGLNTISGPSNSHWYSITFYNENWENITNDNNFRKIYVFYQNDPYNLVEVDTEWGSNAHLGSEYDYGYINLMNYSINSVVSSGGIVQYPIYRTSDIMKQYSLGNQPYYVVPTNPNVMYNGGYYSLTDSQLGDSISYRDISSYVSTNNVSEYSTVINYINNYYSSGSGGGSGGDSGGGSGGDIDWSWLGRIGEIIGGLISALGNVVAGIIEGIANLITSLTENLPNIFGQCVNWLLPFIPQEIVSLLNALFLAILIVGVVRLIRGK